MTQHHDGRRRPAPAKSLPARFARHPVRAARHLRRRRSAAARGSARSLSCPAHRRRRRSPSCPPTSASRRCWISRSGTMESFGRDRDATRIPADGADGSRITRTSAPVVQVVVHAAHGADRRRHRVRGLQRGARRRRHLQAGLRRRRALGRRPAPCSSCSCCRSPTRARRCRARPTSASSCRFSTKARSRRGCSGRSISFFIWWMVSLAIGLGVLYRKRTGPIATTLLAIYVGDRADHRRDQDGTRQEPRCLARTSSSRSASSSSARPSSRANL